MNRSGRFAIAILAIAVGLVFLKEMLGHYAGSGVGRDWGSQQLDRLPSALATPRPTWLADSIGITARPHTGSFDSVFVTDLVIRNASGAAITGLAIACAGIGSGGDTTGHAATTWSDTIPAHGTVTATNVELHFIHPPASVRCAPADSAHPR